MAKRVPAAIVAGADVKGFTKKWHQRTDDFSEILVLGKILEKVEGRVHIAI